MLESLLVVSILEKWCESKDQFYLLQIGIYHYFFVCYIVRLLCCGCVITRACRNETTEARYPFQS